MSATLSEDEKTLRIYGVNSTGERLELRFALHDFPAPVRAGRVYSIEDRDQALDAEIMNTRDDPERVKTVSKAAAVQGREFDFTFAPCSVTLLELELE